MSVYQLYRLSMLRGFGYDEKTIAEKIGVSRKTVSNRLQRMKCKAMALEEQGHGLDDIFFSIVPVVIGGKKLIGELI